MAKTSVVYPIQQPAELLESGNMAVNWREWKSSFDYYLIASGREKATSKEKCALFLHVIGKYGREIYQEFDRAVGDDGTEQEITYDDMVKKYDGRFDPKKNVNFERHVFFETYQKDQCFDSFLSDLKIKSKSCEFSTLKNSLILTQMIRGLKDSRLREKLLAKESLTLEDGVATCRAAERASSQAAACASGKSKAAAAHALHEAVSARGGARGSRASGARGRRSRGGAGRRGGGGAPGPQWPASAPDSRNSACGKCGGWHSSGDKCPASNVKCYRCERYAGHFAKLCDAKIVREVLDCGEGEPDDGEDSEIRS